MWRAILCSLLVVLAGCSFDPGGVGTDAETSTESAVEAAEQQRTASPGDLGTVDPDNPWGESTLTVAIDKPANDSRDYEPLVAEALAFWEHASEEYAGYPIEYELEPNASNPDLVVAFVDDIGNCNNVSDAAGCAPFVDSPTTIDRPEKVEILRGFTASSTLLVLRHELGHTLGLDHGDEPRSVMGHRSTLVKLTEPNATEREFAWADPNFTVYLDAGNVSNPEAVREQVDHALEFYERGANGTAPENVTFAYTDNRSAADVVIAFPETLPCSEDGGSCGSRHGVDTDNDGALERFDRLAVSIHGVDEEAVGWHVGYWLGFGLGFQEPDEWPAVFRNATYDERRSEWWR
jgi:hypothetical protein